MYQSAIIKPFVKVYPQPIQIRIHDVDCSQTLTLVLLCPAKPPTAPAGLASLMDFLLFPVGLVLGLTVYRAGLAAAPYRYIAHHLAASLQAFPEPRLRTHILEKKGLVASCY